MDKDKKITIFDFILLKLHSSKVIVYINNAVCPMYGVLYYAPELCRFNIELSEYGKVYGTFSAYAKDIVSIDINIHSETMIHV